MSTNYTAYAVVGVIVNAKDLFIKSKIKVGNHSYSEDFQFDPKTGKELWTYDFKPIKDVKGWAHPQHRNKDVWEFELESLGKWQAFRINDEKNRFVVGTHCDMSDNDSHSGFMNFPDIQVLKEELQLILVPLGAYDEYTFGIHAVMGIF